MFPPSAPGGVSHIDLSALSGIAGSISIACWVVVFSPQIIENFRRQSADGLSVTFIIIWLMGDVFNILGAILQGVLPTMIILAVYYTLADIVLLGQVWYYRGFTFSDGDIKSGDESRDDENAVAVEDEETTPLLTNGHANGQATANGSLRPQSPLSPSQHNRTGSFSALRRHFSMDGSHLSPATPLLDPPSRKNNNGTTTAASETKSLTTIQTILFNTFALILVCAAGVLGWYISSSSSSSSSSPQPSPPDNNDKTESKNKSLEFDTLGQIFGYLCAVFYLGSRIPQLLLNYRRKSTEGVSLLFFLFACVGNLTYDLSIFAFDPERYCHGKPSPSLPSHHHHHYHDAGHGVFQHMTGHKSKCQPGEATQIYARYIAVNASWIAGSAGTLLLDMAIFVQFFWYRVDTADASTVASTDSNAGVDEVSN